MHSKGVTQSIKAWQQNFLSQLSGIYDLPEIENISAFVLEEIIGKKSPASIKAITPEQYAQLDRILNDLKTGKPLQFVLGFADFYGLKFKVNEHVLIPRPETEELVHLILSDVRNWRLENQQQEIKILDIGTGSGCIAIALKKNIPAAEVSALDVSGEALTVAKENAKNNNADINFIQQDILISDFKFQISNFQIIVSNPPYITISEKDKMHKNVLENEPHTALFVSDEDPLLFYSAIADFSLKHLNKGGKLYFEINEERGEEVKDLLNQKGFTNSIIHKDISGKDRMVSASLI